MNANTTIENSNRALADSNSILEGRDRELAICYQDLRDREETIAARDQTISKQLATISDKDDALKAREVVIKNRNDQLLEVWDRVEKCEQKIKAFMTEHSAQPQDHLTEAEANDVLEECGHLKNVIKQKASQPPQVATSSTTTAPSDSTFSDGLTSTARFSSPPALPGSAEANGSMIPFDVPTPSMTNFRDSASGSATPFSAPGAQLPADDLQDLDDDADVLAALPSAARPARNYDTPLESDIAVRLDHENCITYQETPLSVKKAMDDEMADWAREDTKHAKGGPGWLRKLSGVRRKPGSKVVCLHAFYHRETCHWTVKHKYKYACRECTNKQRPCMLHDEETNKIVLLPIVQAAKARDELTLPSEKGFWVCFIQLLYSCLSKALTVLTDFRRRELHLQERQEALHLGVQAVGCSFGKRLRSTEDAFLLR